MATVPQLEANGVDDCCWEAEQGLQVGRIVRVA